MRWPSSVLLAVLPAASVAVQAQTNPSDGLNSRGQAYSDAAVYAQHKERWLARVQVLPENVDVLEKGAAYFFSSFSIGRLPKNYWNGRATS